jgi:hypothetical protein
MIGKMGYFVNLNIIIERSWSTVNLKMFKKSLLIILAFLLFAALAQAGWTPPMRISDEVIAFDPRIAAMGDSLYVVYWSIQNRSFYLRSDNGGNSWETPLDIAFGDDSSSTLYPLALAAGDTIIVLRRHSFGFANRVNWGLRISTDGGIAWSDILFILPTHNYQLRKYSAFLSSGVLYFIYSRWDQGLLFEFTRSSNWGITWSAPTEVFRTQETGRINMAAKGDTIHFVWAGSFNYDDEWEIYHIRSTDSGENWSGNTMLSTFDDLGSNFPTISINSAGNIVVCWMDYKYSPNLWTGDLFVRYSFNSGNSWTEEDQLTFAHGAFADRVQWQGDSIHISWEDWRYSQADIFYMLSEDNGITWGNQQRVEDDPGMSLAPDLALSEENVHVVWRQDSGMDGPGIYYSRWENESAVWDNKANQLPEDYSLRAYPNPFNSKTIITYNNLKGGEIEIYNINGQKIRTFKTAEIKEGQIEWDARDALGNKVSSGIYFARAGGDYNNAAIKLLYLR